MKLYCISGLGANHLVFEKLSLKADVIPIPWEETSIQEDMQTYAKKLIRHMDTNEPFALLGFSLGGMLAVEMNKLLKPVHTFLISSVATRNELPTWIKFMYSLQISRFVPAILFTSPRFMKIRSNGITTPAGLDVLDRMRGNHSSFMVKANTIKILEWQNTSTPENLTRIHGDRDNLLPAPDSVDYMIKDSGHFAIVENADEISTIINQTLSKL